MLPRDKRAQSALDEVDIPQDDRQNIDNRTTSTAIQTVITTSFSTIGTSGPVTNVAGHIFHGNVNMYNSAPGDDWPVPSSSPSVSPPSQPSAPDIWFGREKIVSSLAEIITSNENPRLAILGAGGMGKTSTALHVIYHEAVVARYQDRAFFVACDAATSADLLVSRILQIIGVSAGAGENLVTVMHLALKRAPPTLLLLDNFESLWEADQDHTAARDLLQKIANSPSSTLIITMRATTPPPGIRWTFFESLPPLPAASAKAVFLAINTTFCDGSEGGDQVLDELLMELDYVPLAIHLLAHVSAGLSPQFILKQWQKHRTHILSLDSYTKDKLESVDVSISLSMESLDVERNTGAIQLLGMLCLLPDGLLRWQDRLEVIEKTFKTATSDLFLLRKFALIYTAGGKLGVLSPIRYFVLQHYPPDSQHVQCIYDIIWELVGTYAPVDYGPELNGATEALGPEMGNISSLIDHAVVHNHPVGTIIDIAIEASWHLCRTHPSHYLLQKVSTLVPSVHTKTQAKYWCVSGNLLYKQDVYAEAVSTLTQARGLFLEIDDRLGAAQCSYRLGEVFRMQLNLSEATTILTDARSQFLEIGDRLGAAQCSQGLGNILSVQTYYSEATAILTDARTQFIEIGDRSGTAHCSRSLGDILRSQGNDSEATAIFTDARDQFIEIGDQSGTAQCSRGLGDILRSQGNVSEATAILKDARAQFIEIGDRLGAAQCSRSLGDILNSQRNYFEATDILTDARAQFIEIGNRAGDAECSASLGAILINQRNYNEAENVLTHARNQFIDIGSHEWTAYCSALLEECSILLHISIRPSYGRVFGGAEKPVAQEERAGTVPGHKAVVEQIRMTPDGCAIWLSKKRGWTGEKAISVDRMRVIWESQGHCVVDGRPSPCRNKMTQSNLYSLLLVNEEFPDNTGRRLRRAHAAEIALHGAERRDVHRDLGLGLAPECMGGSGGGEEDRGIDQVRWEVVVRASSGDSCMACSRRWGRLSRPRRRGSWRQVQGQGYQVRDQWQEKKCESIKHDCNMHSLEGRKPETLARTNHQMNTVE
ncbi:hypothetical protein FIBSPDRAFT_884873 [Athelia psychrophila]|uniref:Novel STAND NTPase 1 domain-containing protein n=1 Tax=Athelia psychrophila TaxID=1759441 RepID=A0A166SH37_9AGAM|nr:hypothetical protein FIBSPDRAFT_884873 [Fibularhizoctonia sp. CBS 109695]